MLNKFFIIIFFIFCSQAVFCQNNQQAQNTDSAEIYRDIEKFSKKHKVSKLIYDLIFRPLVPPRSIKKHKRKWQDFKPSTDYEGKIIRDIKIQTLDPFGYSVYDTNVSPRGFIQKTGNSAHVKTRLITIRNLMLIKSDQVYDSLLVNESERLIRRQPYVREVFLFTIPVKGSSDSVDIFIRVLDNWSIVPNGSASTTLKIDLTDKNFIGLGHQFQSSYAYHTPTNIQTFETNYLITNPGGSYINSQLQYRVNSQNDYIKQVSVDRPFYSPLTKWAGGITALQQSRNDTVYEFLYPDSIGNSPNISFKLQDYWLGKAWKIFPGRTEDDRTTNLIVAARFLNIRYFEKPLERYDSLFAYSNEKFFQLGVGITTRKFVKDRYIFSYGLVEDVPVGRAYGLIGGYQIRESDITRFYAGIRISWGRYSNWGYYSTDFQLGAFLHDLHFEQGVFLGGFNYFTKLLEVGEWKFRQFIKTQVVLGINRFPTDHLSINNNSGIIGFNSPNLYGVHKLLVTLQTQSYTNWNLFGFRFGPYFIFSAGMLGDDRFGFKKSRLYSLFGIGVLIKNEYLVLNYFQVSIAFYPIVPGNGENIFKLNPYQTTDFGFSDFYLGKPGVILYR